MEPSRKPRDDEIDVHGVTHQGKVRRTNQDHFLIATVHKRVHVLATSIGDPERLPIADERIAILAMVADGVGGTEGGEEASTTALEVATQYIAGAMECYYRDDAQDARFIETLQDAALRSHQAVLERAEATPGGKRMATTLTAFMGVWPWYYVLQVGDSRYYLLRDGALTQLSRDQTVAQELVDKGVLTRTAAARSQLSNVLSSAIGGDEAAPVVTRLRSEWGLVHLLCTDGLTKHVPDERIAEVLRDMTSARQACERLLQEALDAGGTDNITVIVGRPVERRASPR